MQYLVVGIILSVLFVVLKMIQTISNFWLKKPITILRTALVLILFLLGTTVYVVFFFDTDSLSTTKELFELTILVSFSAILMTCLIYAISAKQDIKGAVLSGLTTTAAAILFLLVCTYFIFQNIFAYAVIDGNSMFPVVEDGQIVFIDKLNKDIQTGDIIVFGHPRDPSRWQIQRVVASPGDSISIINGKVTINNKPGLDMVQRTEGGSFLREGDVENLRSDEYYVMGDNRSTSEDSRDYGPVFKKNIQGKVISFGF